MGAVGGLLGVNGGAGGTGFASPQSANIQNPVSTADAQASNQQIQDLLAALQKQNGIGNQSQVYNQLQGIANGTGPNPAQAMLNQATGQNVSNQAALAASQRGANANVGLLSRQAAQAGANAQQQSAGQAATLEAQQQLGALNQAGAMANQQAGQQIGVTQGNQQALLNAIAAQNNANVGMQSNINSANAGLAGQQMQNQAGFIGGLGNAAGAAAGLISKPTSLFADGGEVGPRSQFGKMLAQGGNVGSQLKGGGQVPGRAPVGGAKDDYRNDTVDAKLSSGEIVLPRSVTKSNNPAGNAAKFVEAIIKKKGKK